MSLSSQGLVDGIFFCDKATPIRISQSDPRSPRTTFFLRHRHRYGRVSKIVVFNKCIEAYEAVWKIKKNRNTCNMFEKQFQIQSHATLNHDMDRQGLACIVMDCQVKLTTGSSSNYFMFFVFSVSEYIPVIPKLPLPLSPCHCDGSSSE